MVHVVGAVWGIQLFIMQTKIVNRDISWNCKESSTSWRAKIAYSNFFFQTPWFLKQSCQKPEKLHWNYKVCQCRCIEYLNVYWRRAVLELFQPEKLYVLVSSLLQWCRPQSLWICWYPGIFCIDTIVSIQAGVPNWFIEITFLLCHSREVRSRSCQKSLLLWLTNSSRPSCLQQGRINLESLITPLSVSLQTFLIKLRRITEVFDEDIGSVTFCGIFSQTLWKCWMFLKQTRIYFRGHHFKCPFPKLTELEVLHSIID